MDIPELEAFLAVAQTGSFSRAAESLFLTQPAVSSRIASLESQLECKLFDRIGKKVFLTEAGDQLLPRARDILQDMEDARRAVSNLSGEIGGTLKMGTSHHIGLHRLPPVLHSFSENYPGVKIDIRFIDSEEAFEGVMHGDLELGIVTLPPKQNTDIRRELVWRDPLEFVARKNHPLARQKSITVSDLAHYPAVLPSETTFTRKIVENLFSENNVEIEIAVATNYLETLKMMASIGLGWSVLPATMIDSSVHKLKIEGVNIERELGCVYHPHRTLSNAAKEMLNLLREQASG